MYLEKLEINGFKSFAHKVRLEFNQDITAIVGPNGSGKSNVSDAMRWVLGEQSLKLLRGKKSADVIFSGSDKKARLGMAEVSLFFNNEQDEAGLGMSEIVITRRLHRNGDSEYILNNQKCRLTDIHLLLAEAGIARTSYSIIGQGMIDSFLMSSPQERKEFFEDASGVRPLQIKRSSTLSKLSSTEENLETAAIQLREITPRLNSLTRQVKKLDQRQGLETKLKELQVKYFSTLWHDISSKWKNIKHQLDQKVAIQAELQAQVATAEQEISSLTKEKSGSEMLGQLQTKYQQLLSQKMKLSEELSSLKIKTIQTSQKIINHSNVPYETARSVITLLDEIKILQQNIKENILDEDYKTLNINIEHQDNLLNKINTLLEPFKDRETKVDNSKIEAENKIIINKTEEIKKQLETIDQEITATEQDIKNETAKEKNERSQIWEFQQKYQTHQRELNQISSEVNNFRVELARIETRQEDLSREITEDYGDLEEIKQYSQKPLDSDEQNQTNIEINKIKHNLSLIGGIDPEIKNEYEETKNRFDFLTTQTEDLEKSISSLEKMIIDLDNDIKTKFDHSFKIINQKFQQHFTTLFGGGKADLILIKDEPVEKSEAEEVNPTPNKTIKSRLGNNLYSGIEIEATPPGKKLKSINMLSGGERAMTSIALLCAILSANPSPFVVLDEVDAALDEANSIRYADIIENLSSESQFIIITHNRATMEKAGTLYGVTMGGDGVSALLSIKLEKAQEYTNR